MDVRGIMFTKVGQNETKYMLLNPLYLELLICKRDMVGVPLGIAMTEWGQACKTEQCVASGRLPVSVPLSTQAMCM